MDQDPKPEIIDESGEVPIHQSGNFYPQILVGLLVAVTALISPWPGNPIPQWLFEEFYPQYIESPLEVFASSYRAYFLLIPEMLDLTGGILILLLDMVRPNRNRLMAPLIAQTTLIISYFPVIFTMYLTTRYFNAALGQYWGGLETIDPFSLFLKSVVLLTVNYITSYILVGWIKSKPTSTEAALKYFLMGSMSSAFMVFGFAIMYGLSGTTNLYEMKVALHQVRMEDPSMVPVLLMSVLFFMVGIGFKLAIAPFHMYLPDVFSGSTTSVAAFLSVTPKLATTAVFIRVFLLGLSTVADLWVPMMQVCAILSMTIGNLYAIRQTEMKRFLAYSSISNMGYLLLGLCAAGVNAETNANAAIQSLGYFGMLHFMVVYAIMNTGAFLIVSIVEHHTGSTMLANFKGLVHRAPPAAYTMLVILLSLAGIPPLAGFAAKFFVLAPTLETDVRLYPLAIIAVVNMVISAYIYLRIIKVMFLDRPEVEERFYPETTYRYAMIPPFAILFFYFLGGFFVREFFAYAASSSFLTINVYFGSGPGG